MSSVLVYNLIAHIILGLMGVIAFYAVWMILLKEKYTLKWPKILAFVGTLSFFSSWVTGGYYYVKFYGKAVKPVILSGKYPWAHTVITESKEHIFLLLPFLSIAVFLTLWLLENKIQSDNELKKWTAYLSGLIFILGAIIAFAGVAISSAVK